jgi:hypothetical protein
MESPKVFICYAREDAEIAKRLYNDLKSLGIDTWIDTVDLLPGEKWEEKIFKVINKDSDYFIALLSNKAISSEGFFHKELKKATERLEGFPESKIFIIPIRIDDCTSYNETLKSLHRVDLFPSYEDGFWNILRVLAPDRFVNREDELRQTCGKNSISRILFEAPAGYGKTKLLRAVGAKLYEEGWVCIYLEIPKEICSAIEIGRIITEKVGSANNIFNDLNSFGNKIADLLKERVKSKQAPGAVLLIDNIERMKQEEFETFMNYFFAVIQHYPEIKIYFASRIISSLWNERIKGFFKTIFLSPFQYHYVRETIQLCNPTIKECDSNAAYLMQITGGHPGCISQIIESFDFDKESVEESFNNNQDSYKKIILPIIHEIRQSFPESLRNIVEALSVFRRYDFRLLKKILSSGIIEYPYGADKLERELTTACLMRRNIGFIQDDVVRRLLSVRLQWENSEQFLYLCKNAAEMYEQDLQSRISGLELIVVEGIYQELRLAFYQQEDTLTARKQLRDTFFSDSGILKKYLDILNSKPENHDMIANFIGFLEEEKNPDWEFQFAVNFFLRHEQYNNEPYTMLIARVKEFFNWK